MKVRYIGNDSELQGATALAIKQADGLYIQLDRYPLVALPIAECNSTSHPLCFGWHLIQESDWEEIK